MALQNAHLILNEALAISINCAFASSIACALAVLSAIFLICFICLCPIVSSPYYFFIHLVHDLLFFLIVEYNHKRNNINREI
jgi:hypothetical protein